MTGKQLIGRWAGRRLMRPSPCRACERRPGRLRAAGGLPRQAGATPAIVHGDYRLDNLLIDEVHRPAAVVDWELSTLATIVQVIQAVLHSYPHWTCMDPETVPLRDENLLGGNAAALYRGVTAIETGASARPRSPNAGKAVSASRSTTRATRLPRSSTGPDTRGSSRSRWRQRPRCRWAIPGSLRTGRSFAASTRTCAARPPRSSRSASG